MDIKKIRKWMAVVGGALASIMAVVFLLILDTKAKIDSSWLIGLAVFGVGGGLLMALSGLSSEDEEDKNSALFGIISMVFLICFAIVMYFIPNIEEYIKFVKQTKNAYLVIVYWITFVASLLSGIISIFHGVTTARDFLAYIKATKKYDKKVNLMRIIVPAFSLFLVIFGFLSLALFSSYDGYAKLNFKFDDLGLRYTDEYNIHFNGLGLFLGLASNLIVDCTRITKIPYNVPPASTIDVTAVNCSFNFLLALPLILVVVGVTLYAACMFIKKTKNHFLVRTIAGLLILVGGILMFLSDSTLNQTLIVNNTSLPEVEGIEYTLGLGPILFASFTAAAGFILMVLSLLDLRLKADDAIVVSAEIEAL